jgi:anti-sigma factor RsiW
MIHGLKKIIRWIARPFGYHCGHTQKLLFDYAEGLLDPQIAAKLELHLSDCPRCIEYVRTYRETKDLCAKYGRLLREMPPELEKKLCEFIRNHLKQD